MRVLFEKVPEQAKVPGQAEVPEQARDDGEVVVPAKAGILFGIMLSTSQVTESLLYQTIFSKKVFNARQRFSGY